MESILVENLKKTYNGKIQALDGLSFTVKRGSIFGLVGPNGAGKSTAIKIMTTLAVADSGTATIEDYDVSTAPNYVRKIIGCVSQSSGVYREGTARENLTLQGELYGMRGSRLKVRVSQLIDCFGLTAAADRIAATYSGGMIRKLDVALGMIHRPRILFLDEPTTGLDPEARSSLWETILELSNQENVTVLLTTHYLEEVDKLADKVAIVNNGKVIVEGTPASLKDTLNEDMICIKTDNVSEHGTDDFKKALYAIRSVHRIEISGNTIKFHVSDASSKLIEILQFLSSCQVHVLSASITPPSIDDVYLKYTKK